MAGSGGVSTAAKPGTAKGGRPSQIRAQQIGDEILDVATGLFLSQGYGATSIEAIAQQAGMSKRTLYHRFANKAELFAAVVDRLVTRLRPKQVAPLFLGDSPQEILQRLATIILRATLTHDALALHRLMLTEAQRFPELGRIINAQGTRQEAIDRIAGMLESHGLSTEGQGHASAQFMAEQFMQMVVSVPQRRAMGLGTAMNPDELAAWAKNSVDLFLRGCGLLEHRL